jgi:hypothetical protein
MKKQKLLAQVFAISSSLIFALGLASCDDNIHTHEYGEWEITTPPNL